MRQRSGWGGMNMKRRILSMMMALSLFAGIAGAHAETAEEFYMSADAQGVTINYFLSECESYVIPDQVNGQPVVALLDNAFYQKAQLKELTIPESVASIGENTFQGCENLKLIVHSGSYAEEYAQAKGIEYSIFGAPSFPLTVESVQPLQAKLSGYEHSAAAAKDGTVAATGENSAAQCDMTGWTDIVAVAAGYRHTVGLKSDGTVVAAGGNEFGECEVGGWQGVVSLDAGANVTVGVKADGSVIAAGDGSAAVSGWTDVQAVAVGLSHFVGLKNDGTVVAAGDDADGKCDVSAWKDIVAVSAGAYHTVGLKADGTVVAAGWNAVGACDVDEWTDIVAVSAGDGFTVGLKSDGTVVLAGVNSAQTQIGVLSGIVAVSAGARHTLAMMADGTVLAMGVNTCGECNVIGWRLL